MAKINHSYASALISTETLAAKLGLPGWKILDASWHMPRANRSAKEEYKEGHIPGAQFFDLDEFSDQKTALPHMLPGAAEFKDKIEALGISSSDIITVYDTDGLFSAARAWWMLRAMGHERIYILSGGYPKWRAEGHAISGEAEAAARGNYTVTPVKNLTVDKDNIKREIHNNSTLILDARSAERFSGMEADPRPGVRSGHIPGSINLHYKELLEETFHQLKSPSELVRIMQEKEIDWARPVIATCGSGVTACILALAFYELGNKDVAVYDGSWSEWGADLALPVVG